jgi:hypothetical protein
MYELQRKAREKQIIRVYKDFNDREGYRRKKGLQTIGEYKEKKEYYDKERGLNVIRFRQKLGDYLTVYSDYPMQKYLDQYYIDDFYWMIYLIDAQLYRKKLEKPEKRKLGLAIQGKIWQIYNGLFGFEWGILGPAVNVILFSLSFMMGFSALISNRLALIGLFVGIAAGLLFTIFNHFLDKNIGAILMKRKVETVKYEYYLTPKESPNKVIYDYEVKGKKLKGEIKSDNMIELEQGEFTESVEGFEKVYRMINNPKISVEAYKKVGKKHVRKTDKEMQELTRTKFERNKEYAERIMEQQTRIAKMKRRITELTSQLQYVRESQIEEIRELSEELDRIKAKKNNTIAAMVKNLEGDAIGKPIDMLIRETIEDIEKRRDRLLLNELKTVIQVSEKVLKKLGEKGDLSEEIMQRIINRVKVDNLGNGGSRNRIETEVET